jgi:hypothetical protein
MFQMAEHTLKRVAFLLVLALTPRAKLGCKPGPPNCTFEKRDQYGGITHEWCGWQPNTGWAVFYFGNNRVSGLATGSTTGRLESQKVCSTGEQTFCLSFLYSFDVDDIIDLNVYIHNTQSDARQDRKVWTASTSPQKPANVYMDRGRIPVQTTYNYIVAFEAVRCTGQIDSVYIDDVEFERSACIMHPPGPDPSVLRPPTLRPSMTGTTPRGFNTEKTTTDSRPVFTTPPDRETQQTTPSVPRPETTHPDEPRTPSPDDETRNTTSDSSSGSILIIVIVVIVAVVDIIITVAIVCWH